MFLMTSLLRKRLFIGYFITGFIVISMVTAFVLNLGHNPLYGHFCKCLYIEMLKISLVY